VACESFAFDFFYTNHCNSPCIDFLVDVVVVSSNSGGLMTSVTMCRGL
jgi:hypothetical protein